MTFSFIQNTHCIRAGLLVALLCLMAGCVTTERGGFTAKKNEQQALNYSVQLARNYIRERNWEMAKRHLKAAVEIDDSSAEVYEALALVFQNTGEFERAENAYKKAIDLDGSLSRVRLNYAAFLYDFKQYEKAAKQLEIVVDDTLYNRRLIAFVNLGRCYVQLGKFKKAESAFRRAYLMDRSNYSVAFALADVYFRMEDYVKSQQFYDSYRRGVKTQVPQALWLGIRLADKFGNKDAFSSYSLALKNLYPNSREYLEFKNTFEVDG